MNLCRTCLEDYGQEKSYPLFQPILNVEYTLASMLNAYLPYEIIEGDDYSSNVCETCFKLLRMSYNFFNRAYKSQELLLSRSAEEQIKVEVVKDTTDKEEDVKAEEETPDDKLVYITEPLEFENEEASHIIYFEDSDEPPQAEEKSDTTKEENLKIPDVILKSKTVFACPLCDFKSRLYKTFTNHVTLKHTEPAVKCQFCGNIFNRKEFPPHFRQVHRYQCNQCPKTFKSSHGAWYHRSIAHGEFAKQFKCTHPNCKQMFLWKNHLRKHEQIHSETANFECSECGSAFKSYDMYRFHTTRVHEGRHITICSVCGKQFVQRSHYLDHMWIHNGLKRHQCQHCGIRYTRGSSLKKHKRVCVYHDEEEGF